MKLFLWLVATALASLPAEAFGDGNAPGEPCLDLLCELNPEICLTRINATPGEVAQRVLRFKPSVSEKIFADSSYGPLFEKVVHLAGWIQSRAGFGAAEKVANSANAAADGFLAAMIKDETINDTLRRLEEIAYTDPSRIEGAVAAYERAFEAFSERNRAALEGPHLLAAVLKDEGIEFEAGHTASRILMDGFVAHGIPLVTTQRFQAIARHRATPVSERSKAYGEVITQQSPRRRAKYKAKVTEALRNTVHKFTAPADLVTPGVADAGHLYVEAVAKSLYRHLPVIYERSSFDKEFDDAMGRYCQILWTRFSGGLLANPVHECHV